MIHGNLLKDEITNLPVIIVEKNVLYGLVDSFVLDNLDNIVNGKWINETNSKIYEFKFKLIPFSSLGNKNGLLLGFKPDYIKVYMNDDFFEKKAIIGIYKESLGGNSEYNSIVGL